MKKVVLVGAIALLSLASCKKEYTCECNTIDLDSQESVSNEKITIKSTSKDKAQEECFSNSHSNEFFATGCVIN